MNKILLSMTILILSTIASAQSTFSPQNDKTLQRFNGEDTSGTSEPTGSRYLDPLANGSSSADCACNGMPQLMLGDVTSSAEAAKAAQSATIRGTR